jgi:hypothetical protein
MTEARIAARQPPAVRTGNAPQDRRVPAPVRTPTLFKSKYSGMTASGDHLEVQFPEICCLRR